MSMSFRPALGVRVTSTGVVTPVRERSRSSCFAIVAVAAACVVVVLVLDIVHVLLVRIVKYYSVFSI